MFNASHQTRSPQFVVYNEAFHDLKLVLFAEKPVVDVMTMGCYLRALKEELYEVDGKEEE